MIKTRISSLFGRDGWHTSYAPWILLGFSISYVFFFLGPVFFSTNVMQFIRYVPAAEHIGLDLKQTLSFSQFWFPGQNISYVRSNNYPPLASLLFTPLLFVKFFVAYRIVTLLSVLSYVFMLSLGAFWVGKRRHLPALLMLVLITGLFSYGFQFELERGQFDLITVVLTFLAIWIYHRHNRYRYVAYFLFCISVQLKLYPYMFIVLLIRDWQDWKNNIVRIAVLTIANIAFLFVFGRDIFMDFVNATQAHTVNPYIWVGNHSIHSFVTLVLRFASRHGASWLMQFSGLMEWILLVTVVSCIFLIMLQMYRQKRTGVSPHLLLAATLGALLLPPVSHDYRLSILAAPVAILFVHARLREEPASPSLQILRIVAIFALSFAYSSTLFTSAAKPYVLANNLPALFIMLFTVTFLALSSPPPPEASAA